VICVIVAGWTTANPTIYRAGLAFQAIVPSASRYRVTLATGAVATIVGLFPAVAMRLLDFVALYGLLLMPMGAVIFVDFWLGERFGFRPNLAERARIEFNWAAAITWVATLAVCVGLVLRGDIQLYFVSARAVPRRRSAGEWLTM
jgi:purine-cytosine permease-like protein